MPWRQNANDHDVNDVHKQNCKPFQGARLSLIAHDVDAPAKHLNRRLADELLTVSTPVFVVTEPTSSSDDPISAQRRHRHRDRRCATDNFEAALSDDFADADSHYCVDVISNVNIHTAYLTRTCHFQKTLVFISLCCRRLNMLALRASYYCTCKHDHFCTRILVMYIHRVAVNFITNSSV